MFEEGEESGQFGLVNAASKGVLQLIVGQLDLKGEEGGDRDESIYVVKPLIPTVTGFLVLTSIPDPLLFSTLISTTRDGLSLMEVWTTPPSRGI